MDIKDLAKLFDLALDYENDIITTVETITEYKQKMWDKKDVRILKSIIPLLDTLVYEAEQYKEWLENEVYDIPQSVLENETEFIDWLDEKIGSD